MTLLALLAALPAAATTRFAPPKPVVPIRAAAAPLALSAASLSLPAEEQRPLPLLGALEIAAPTPAAPASAADVQAAPVFERRSMTRAADQARALSDALLSEAASSDAPESKGPGSEAATKPARRRGSAKGPRAVQDVRAGDAVSLEHAELLDQSLRRRATSWIYKLGKVGVSLAGPVEPVLRVVSADLRGAGSKRERVSYHIEWTQGVLRRGAFQAEIPLKSREPSLRKTSPSLPPAQKQMTLRFRPGTSESEAVSTLERFGLTLLSRSARNEVVDYRVDISLARWPLEHAIWRLQQEPSVLFAMPGKLDFPAERQYWIVVNVDAGQAGEDALTVLSKSGHVVLEAKDGGYFRIGAPTGMTGARAARLLSNSPALLYAAPAGPNELAESRLAVVSFPGWRGGRTAAVSDSFVSKVLRHYGLRVVADYGGREFKVYEKDRKSGAEIVAALAGVPSVTAHAVGTLPDAAVDVKVRDAISRKTGDMVDFETTKSRNYSELERLGATRRQLARYVAEVDAVPNRFSSWSTE